MTNNHYKIYLVILLTWVTSFPLAAQLANDECEGAIEILDPINYCSGPRGFSNDDATESGFGAPPCWQGKEKDIWFRFTARFTAVSIIVNGFSGQAGGGTITDPQIAIYNGSCNGTINELDCISDVAGDNIVELQESGLIPGTEYLIRIDGINGRDGSFELCIRNFNPPAAASSDCPTAAVLCDKTPFVVQNIEGFGTDGSELVGATCFVGSNGQNNEFNSVWFKWICDRPGTLTFDLTPLNPIDDLDFVLFELPNGIDDCSQKDIIRCMAAGENPIFFPSDCHGPTGLREGAGDISENSGCDQGQDNYIEAIDMVAGRAYALGINNFTDAGNGIQISFGGTGTFLGPRANFTVSPTSGSCYGTPVIVQDQSSFALGTIEGWEWTFGPDATPSFASGPGPHQVEWASPGNKSIALSVTTDRGCTVTEIRSFVLDPCCETDNAINLSAIPTDLLCNDSQDGIIDATATSNSTPLSFLWDNGETTEDINGLAPGTYTLIVRNEATCEDSIEVTIGAPAPFDFNPVITMPTCMAGQDGAIELQTSGATPPYQYDFGSGFSNINTIQNIPVGIYPVTIRDANGCIETLNIDVRELELTLDSDIPTVTPPSCFDTNDGSIVLNVENGLPPFEFDFDDGNGFVSTNQITGLNSGVFNISFRDANGCIGDTAIVVTPPEPLSIITDQTDISCAGADDGEAIPFVSGGVGNYQFNWSNGQTDSIATGLEPGIASLTVTDANGCTEVTQVEITQPNPVFIDVTDIVDAICFGDSTGVISVIGSGGSPGYEYSIDGQFFQPGTDFSGLPAGEYVVVVRDVMGCTAEIIATIDQPVELIVDAGQDKEIDLGFEDQLFARVIPPLTTVTYLWTPADSLSCTDCPNPTANPTNDITYQVLVTDENGCTATDEVRITVRKERPIYIPNAFTPNADGINDFFTLYGGPAVENIKLLRVYSRWGALIYEGRDLDISAELQGWNGTINGRELPPDVFAFYAVVRFVDQEEVLYEGDITLLK